MVDHSSCEGNLWPTGVASSAFSAPLAMVVHCTSCRVESAVITGTLSALGIDLRGNLEELSRLVCGKHRLLRLKKEALVMDMLHYCR